MARHTEAARAFPMEDGPMTIRGKLVVTIATLLTLTACGGADAGRGESGESGESTSEALLTGREFGWAWAQQATGSFIAADAWSRNSSGDLDAGGVPATITNTDVGRYTVEFPNIGLSTDGNGYYGNPQVTAYGPGTERCQIRTWYPSGTGLLVEVWCSSPVVGDVFGFANTQFAVSFNVETSASDLGYAYISNEDLPLNETRDVLWSKSFNSTGGTNTVVRTGTGTYRVSFPGVNGADGVAEVSAVANLPPAYCKVVNWSTSGVNVACFNIAGGPMDSGFTLAYGRLATRGGSSFGYATIQKGGSFFFPTWSVTNARTRLTSPFTFPHDGGSAIFVRRTSVGHFSVTFPELIPTLSSVKVTARGAGSASCKVVNWLPDGKVGTTASVFCFTGAGAATDSDFTISYTTSPAATWSQLVSEEGNPVTACGGNSGTGGFRCIGSYCDSLSLRCSGLPPGTSMNVATSAFTDWFSEENADITTITCGQECVAHALNEGRCPSNSVITALQCAGAYCDWVRVRCTTLATGHVDTSRCVSSGYQSEEQGGVIFPPGFFATAMDCTGSYCDNSSFRICPVVP
jgi:hypothetical protein